MAANGFVRPTKEEVQTYDAMISLQYSGEHFRSQMKALAKRSRNKAVGRVLQSNPQRITVFMDDLNNPGIKVDGNDLFTVYPEGILWHKQDPDGKLEYTLVQLVKFVIETYTNAEWDNSGYYIWRGYNTKYSDMVIKADNVDERVFTESGILQHSPRPFVSKNSSAYGQAYGGTLDDFTVVNVGEHWKGGRFYYNRTDEDKIVQDHSNCEVCTLTAKVNALLVKEAEDTDKWMLEQGGGSLANERWFPYRTENFDPKLVPTLIARGVKTMRKVK